MLDVDKMSFLKQVPLPKSQSFLVGIIALIEIFNCDFYDSQMYLWASLVAQMLKNLPTRQEIQIYSLGWEYPLEKGMATYSSILAWKISRTEEPGGL